MQRKRRRQRYSTRNFCFLSPCLGQLHFVSPVVTFWSIFISHKSDLVRKLQSHNPRLLLFSPSGQLVSPRIVLMDSAFMSHLHFFYILKKKKLSGVTNFFFLLLTSRFPCSFLSYLSWNTTMSWLSCCITSTRFSSSLVLSSTSAKTWALRVQGM